MIRRFGSLLRYRFSRLLNAAPTAATREPRLARPGLELLEDRTLPAPVTTSLSNGILTVTGTAQNDVITVKTNVNAKLSLTSGTGAAATVVKIQSGSTALSNVAINLVSSVRVNAGAGNDKVSCVEGVPLTVPITITGGEDNDTLSGASGADTLLGENGADILNGGSGNDTLTGGAGTDTFTSGPGTDRLTDVQNDNVTDTDWTKSLIVNGVTYRLSNANQLFQVVGSKPQYTLRENDVGSVAQAANTLYYLNAGGTLKRIPPGSASAVSVDTDVAALQADPSDQLTGYAKLNGATYALQSNGTFKLLSSSLSENYAVLQTVSPQARATVTQALGNALATNLPLFAESLGDVLDMNGMIQAAFNIPAGTPATLTTLRAQLEQAGFEVGYLGLTPETGSNDLMRLRYRRSFDVSARFNFEDARAFSYFGDSVTGDLRGNAQTTNPHVELDLTFGIDLIDDRPVFFLAESSSISVTNVVLQGSASGNLSIRWLAYVQAQGQIDAALNAQLTVTDQDGVQDHKLRLPQIQVGQGIQGRLQGSVDLAATFSSHLPILDDINWSGSFHADIDTMLYGSLPHFSVPNLQLPDATALIRGLASNLLSFSGGQIPLLSNLNGLLDVDLPFNLGELKDKIGLGGDLGWLTSAVSGSVSSLDIDGIGNFLNQYNIKLHVTNANAADSIQRMLKGERVDLLSFHSSGGDAWGGGGVVPLGVILIGPVPVSVSVELGAHVGWQYNVGVGIDTTGFWIDPATRIGISGDVHAGIRATVGIAGIAGVNVSAGAELSVFAGLGLNDPDPSDGRIYLDEIIRSGDNFGEAFLRLLHFRAGADLGAYIHAEADLPWPLPDITLIDESFAASPIYDSNGTPTLTQSKRLLPLGGAPKSTDSLETLVRIENGQRVLVLNGSDNDDSFFVSGTGTTVLVSSTSIRGKAENIQRVRFFGNGGNDNFGAPSGFAVPIEAFGGSGDDSLTGGQADDRLDGEAGNDTVTGRGGNDRLQGGSGMDLLSGDAGADILEGGDGDDVLQGGADGDSLFGDAGIDTLSGDAGDDSLSGGAGNDHLLGGAGNDAVAGDAGDDYVSGEDGTDTLHGNDGNDYLRGGAGGDHLFGDAGNDQLSGGAAGDDLHGGDGNDILAGEEGGDVLHGDGDDDTLYGGNGEDEVHGEAGDDSLVGGDGDDVVRGGDGNDSLRGGNGFDQLYGDAGEDRFAIDFTTNDGDIIDLISGGLDKDSIVILGTNPAQSHGSVANADFEFDVPDRYTDDQGSGNDIITLTQVPGTAGFEATARLAEANVQDARAVRFTIPDDVDEVVIDGGGGNDLVVIDAGVGHRVTVEGGAGDDNIQGGSGADTLRGGMDNDQITGGAGHDTIHGGTGDDVLDGQAGDDALYGEDGGDILTGGTGRNVLYGGANGDTLRASEGGLGDAMFGQGGEDKLYGAGGVDVLDGGDANDEIHGGGLGDIILGGTGDDLLFGDGGIDIILGQEGNDVLWASNPSDDVTLSDPNWRVKYFELFAREQEYVKRIDVIEARLAEPDVSADERAGLEQESTDLQNQVVLINEAETELLPRQTVRVDTLLGGDDNDVLHGTGRADFVEGGGGDDVIYHSPGQDSVYGGEGNNDVYVVEATAGNDMILFEYEDATGDVRARVNNATGILLNRQGIEIGEIHSLAGNDSISLAGLGHKVPLRFVLTGGDGDDAIDATIFEGPAVLEGNAGSDLLFGGFSTSRLYGGDGRDYLRAGGTRNELHGDGQDVFDMREAEATRFGATDALALMSDTTVEQHQAGTWKQIGYQMLPTNADFLMSGVYYLNKNSSLHRITFAGGDVEVRQNVHDYVVTHDGQTVYTLEGGQKSVFGWTSSGGWVHLNDNILSIALSSDDRLYDLTADGRVGRLRPATGDWDAITDAIVAKLTATFDGTIYAQTKDGKVIVLNDDGRDIPTSAVGYHFDTPQDIRQVTIKQYRVFDHVSWSNRIGVEYSDDGNHWILVGAFDVLPDPDRWTQRETNNSFDIFPSGVHSYWRVRDLEGVSQWHVFELVFKRQALSQAGTPFAEGTRSGYPPALAFDRNIDSHWESDAVAFRGKLGYVFDTPQSVQRFSIYQYRLQDYTWANRIALDYSDNGSDWVNVGVYPITPNNEWTALRTANTFNLPDSGTHRYWRVVDADDQQFNTQWHVFELDFKRLEDAPLVGQAVAVGTRGGFVPGDAFDGDLQTTWESRALWQTVANGNVVDVAAPDNNRFYSLTTTGRVRVLEANGEWTPVSDSNVLRMLVGGDGRLYTLSSDRRVRVLQDDNLNWKVLSDPIVTQLDRAGDGRLYVFCTDGVVRRYDRVLGGFEAVSNNNVVEIAVADQGQLYALYNDHYLRHYRFAHNDYEIISSPNVLNIAVADNGRLYALSDDQRLRRYAPERNDFDIISTPGVVKIAAPADGRLYVIFSNQRLRLYRPDANDYEEISNSTLDIAVADRGQLYILGDDHRVRRYDTVRRDGIIISTATFNQIVAASDGRLYSRNIDDNIRRYEGGDFDNWTRITSTGDSPWIGYRDVSRRLYRLRSDGVYERLDDDGRFVPA